MRPDLDTSRGVCFTIILGHILYIQKVGARNVYCKKSGQKMYIAKSLGQKMYNPIVETSKKARTEFPQFTEQSGFPRLITNNHNTTRVAATSTTPPRGTTTTWVARRGIWNGARVSMEGTTNGRESGTRTVKAGPRGHDDSVSHTPRRAFYQQTRWRFATLLSDFQRPRHKLLPVQGDTRK